MNELDIEQELESACRAFASTAAREAFELADQWLEVAFTLRDMANAPGSIPPEYRAGDEPAT